MITFDSESSLLLAPYLTHLMRMTFKFLNPIPMKQVFLSISNMLLSFIFFHFSNYGMQAFRKSNHPTQLYSLHCTNVPRGCEGQGGGWLAQRKCMNINVCAKLHNFRGSQTFWSPDHKFRTSCSINFYPNKWDLHFTIMIDNLFLTQSNLRHKANYKWAFFKEKENLSLPS